MAKYHGNPRFEKSDNSNNMLDYQKHQKISLNQQKREILKGNLIKKYNLSEKEAENIILRMEQKFKHTQEQKPPQNKFSKANPINIQESFNNGGKNNIKPLTNINSGKYFSDLNSDDTKHNFHKSNNLNSYRDDLNNNKNNQIQYDNNVDVILSDIIPEYNQNVVIDLKNVDLTFEVTNERIDTLKESFIRSIKRNKSEKIKIHALNNITFKIYKGEKIGIIGYNGAGKSTLLKVICGIFTPDYGEVKTNGKISPMLALGAGFDFNYSGRKNIFFNGAVLGYEREFLESKLDEIIEFSELGDYIDIPIKNYSSGMLAKLSFSIATIVNPDILIIDEILGVGDVNFRKKSGDKIRSLMDGGATVLLVSHSIPQIRELCDKAIWIDNGKIRAIGEVNKVCDSYIKDSEKANKEQLMNIQFR